MFLSFVTLKLNIRFKLLLGLTAAVLSLWLVSFTHVQAAELDSSETTEYLVAVEPGYESSLLAVDSTPELVFANQQGLDSVYVIESRFSLEELQQALSGKYHYIEPNRDYKVEFRVNDPGFTKNSTNIDKQWGLEKAEFSDSWDVVTASEDVVIAVIDTGIDVTHEDFEDTNFVAGYNFVSDRPLPVNTGADDNGHGTLVAGVIAATADNNTGIAGAAFGASIMPIKALNRRGSGSSDRISRAIVWATDNGADIINMSLGGLGFEHDSTLANAIAYAYERGVVLVAAAGNDVDITGGNLDDDPVFPICHDNGQNMIIGVTATDHKDIKPNFANYGKVCVDVTAPGKRILSTINYDPVSGDYEPDAYAYASGTSLAVPFVSAQAALLKSKYPDITNIEVRDLITSTADSVDRYNTGSCGGSSCRGLLGSGRINVISSLREERTALELVDGDIVRVPGSDLWYLVSGGKRQLISEFVKSQRYQNVRPKVISLPALNSLSEGSYAPPLDGTLVKVLNNPTIYEISKGVKLPITAQVFALRGYQLGDVKVLPDTEANSWVQGSFLAPPEGTLIRSFNNPTVYWVVGQVLHPINARFYEQRGLSIFPVVFVSGDDLQSLPIGEDYTL